LTAEGGGRGGESFDGGFIAVEPPQPPVIKQEPRISNKITTVRGDKKRNCATILDSSRRQARGAILSS
jgi:hypothetical protein